MFSRVVVSLFLKYFVSLVLSLSCQEVCRVVPEYLGEGMVLDLSVRGLLVVSSEDIL